MNRTPLSLSVAGAFLALGLVLPLQTPGAKPSAKNTPPPKLSEGARMFKAQCASCHGDKGQGGPGYAKPLIGERSVAQLAQYIHKMMPPNQGTPLKQAQEIAKFAHAEFYSPVAQERNRPVKIEMARLTNKQLRNAVADLVGAWHPVTPNTTERGLSAEYFKSQNFDGRRKAFDRTDALVKFDFKQEGPTKDFDPYSFAIIWNGSLLAPDTGEYEIVVRTNQAFRLWLNDNRRNKPLIDGWVRSANDFEFVAPIKLLGGRAYPLRIEFSKSTQGVQDQNKDRQKPPAPAQIELAWRRPKRTVETIPTRMLFPQTISPTFVVTAKLPPDDRSMGFERGSSVSREWDDAVTNAALEAAEYIGSNLAGVTGIPENDPDRRNKTKSVMRQFVERAFRRPVTPAIEEVFVTRQFAGDVDLETAVRRTVILTLKSPRFLFREAGAARRDAHGIASHLSFALWDTVPDPELTQAAASGALLKPEEVRKHADRLASDPRAWAKMRDFLLFWLKVDEVPDLIKSPKRYPEFDAVVASDLRTSLELFLEATAWAPKSDYRELMLGRSTFLNGRLAKLYAVNLPADADFQPVVMDGGRRAGVLMHPYVLSRFAYLEATSPIHRGVLIARSMLGRTLAPPPEAFAPLAPSLHPTLSTRERVALQTKPTMCMSCHSMINPLGFALERFDAVGKLRETDNGKPILSTGYYLTRTGEKAQFQGANDLARFLANEEEAHEAFVEKLFLHMTKQAPLAYGAKTLPDLADGFAKEDFNIRRLLSDIAVRTAGTR